MGSFNGTTADFQALTADNADSNSNTDLVNFYQMPDGTQRLVGSRVSGCSFANFILTLQPRKINGAGNFCLDLLANPITTVPLSASSDEGGFSDDNGSRDAFTFDTAGNAVSYTIFDPSKAGKPGTTWRYITAMASGSTGAAIASWFLVDTTTESINGSCPPLSVLPLQIVNGVVTQPDQSTLSNLDLNFDNLDAQPQTLPRDLCCTVIDNLVYYFLVFFNDPSVYYFVYDGEAVSAVAKLENSDQNVVEQWSLDSSTVYSDLGGAVTSDSLPQFIALTSAVTQAGPPKAAGLNNWLLQPDNIKPGTVFSSQTAPPNLSLAQNIGSFAVPDGLSWLPEEWDSISGAFVRNSWGSPWGRNRGPQEIDDGLMLSLMTQNFEKGDQDFVTEIAISCLDVTTTENTGYNWDFISLNPPHSGHPTYNTYTDQFCFFSVSGNELDANNNETGNLWFASAMSSAWSDAITGHTGQFPQPYLVQWPAFTLVAAGEPDSGLVYEDSWTVAQFQAAIPSWTLLGVIAGAPPNGVGLGLKSTVTFQTTTSDNAQFSMDTKVTFGINAKLSGESGSISAGFSEQTSQTSVSGETFTVQLSETFSYTDGDDSGIGVDETDQTDDVGYLVYLVPNYTRQDFTFTNWSGSGIMDSMTMSMLSVNSNSAIMNVPFSLSEPNTPSGYGDLPDNLKAAVAAFPSADFSWAKVTDTQGWKTIAVGDAGNFKQFISNPISSDDQTKENPIFQSPGETIDVGSNFNESTTLGASFSRTLASTNTLSLDGSLNLGPLSLGGNYQLASGSSATLSTSTLFQYFYGFAPAVTPANTGSTYSLECYFFVADANGLPWIPNVSQQQRPWLITWYVF